MAIIAKQKNKAVLTAEMRVEAELCRRFLKLFVKKVWPIIEPTPFVDGMPIDAMVAHLEAVSRGDIKRLLINIPPRHTKSTLMTIWRVWTWLRDPSARFLSASYNLNLSIRDNSRVRRIIEDPWFQECYGKRFQLREDQNAKSYFENDHGGYQMAISVAGGTTGHGGSYLVIDDMHNADEAHSDAERGSAVTWFREVWTNRLNDQLNDKMVVVGQRIHEEDVCGYILKERPDWTHLNLPALYEPTRHCTTPIWSDPRQIEGSLLWPERFDERILAGLKRDLGSIGFAAQYQQSPVPAGGGQFKQQWFKYLMQDQGCYILDDSKVLKDQCRHFLTADLAVSLKQTADLTVVCAWAITPSRKLLLLDCVADRLDNPNQVKMIEMMFKKHSPEYALIESVAYQLSLTQQLRRLGLPIREYRPVRDKVARASTAAVYYEQGQIYHLQGATWLPDFESELLMFPMGAHDDRVDNVSMAAEQLPKASSGVYIENDPEEEYDESYIDWGRSERR